MMREGFCRQRAHDARTGGKTFIPHPLARLAVSTTR